MRAARIAGLLAGAALAVSAFCLGVFADTITLTPSQTVALIGANVQGTVYSNDTIYNQPCYAVWTGHTTSEYVAPNYIANMLLYGNPASYPSFTTAFPDFSDRNYLIYAILPTTSMAVGWPTWKISDSSAHTDFTCNFSLPIQSCTSMRFSVLYTAASAYDGIYGNVNNSSALLSRSGAVVGRHPLGAASQHSRFALGMWPFYNGTYQDTAQVPENARQRLAMIPMDNTSETEFSVSGFSVGLNMVRAVNVDSDSPLHDISNGFLDPFVVPLLLIECPTISDYVPQVTTTAVTTRPQYPLSGAQTAATVQTVDLSQLESGVAAIVEQGIEANNNLDWIGGNVMIGVNNLAYIANRLDDIYSAMQQAGQIPVDATGEFMNGVQSGLTSYTTARIPTDAAAGLTFWAWLMGKIMEQAWIAELAALGSCLAVTYFILFRGRNS